MNNLTKVISTETDQNYKFKFSIIMSVYKVEEFIREAIDSIIAQDIGFAESVQIILVDDGSPDGSGAICDEYAARYPENILVIHKENGGLSSARNEGLKYIEGRYVNFFDPDDILSENTLSDVYSFFAENEKFVDIVAIPLYYFGDKTGPHHLNNKFNMGTRVINLEKEYRFSHLSAASSFFRHEIAATQHYDSKLVVAEDAEQILRELIDNSRLGVVDSCSYFYRRRGDSQVTAGSNKKGWYTDYLHCLCLRTFEYAKKKYGYVPRFVQNSIMGDLRWRFTEEDLPKVLTNEEIEEYKRTLDEVIRYIDDDVIMMQSSLILDTKISILYRKHGDSFIKNSHDNIYYGTDYRSDWSFSRNTLQLCFADTEGEYTVLRMRQVVLAAHVGKVQLAYADFEGARAYSDSLHYEVNKTSIGDPVSYYLFYSIKIPTSKIPKNGELPIRFFTVVDGIEILNTALTPGYLFPASAKYSNAFATIDDVTYSIAKGSLFLSRPGRSALRSRRIKFLKELWKSNQLGERKAVLARTAARIYKFFHPKPIWIVSDRLNKAGDNGEALFRYVKESKFKKASVFYAITDCDDAKRLAPLGGVIRHSSWKYKMLFLASDFIISSHADDFVINPFFNYYEPYRDIIKTKRFVFLQHGVTKDDISGWLNRYNKNIVGFVCAANDEWKSIVETETYHYPKEHVWLTGFSRFDRLYRDEKKYITVMPTWRKYLMKGYDPESGVWKTDVAFKNSEYYRFYNSLINNERLLDVARKHGYTICFMPHPNIITRSDMFTRAEGVKFFTINDEYRKVYAESNLILSDYSSAVFDFAYLRKPVVYSQFDKDEFFKGDHVYTKGYFDYERDGFGEVTYDLDSTVSLLIEYIENDCRLKPEYQKRIDSFFAYSDKENSKRIVQKMLELSK